ncbi:uncharacterized protein LOC103515899, partial [Diaphorina citri]|uniref:Uncharacterized protein LOC103515899 n=1 Tax=Diaphorina citri TaxID=121845 RepID=A0A3Q0JC14_DIACI
MLETYMGIWYEAERYFAVFEFAGKCVSANYTNEGNGIYRVVNTQTSSITGITSNIEGEIRVFENFRLFWFFSTWAFGTRPRDTLPCLNLPGNVTGITSNIEGEIRVFERSDTSKFFIKFPSLPMPMDAPYWILGTDYDNFAVVWSCIDLRFFSTKNAWILTREKLPSGTALQKAYGVLDKYKLSRYFFSKTDQNDCYIAEAANENNAVDSDGNDAVEQTADGVYKNADASASPVANPEASPVSNASPAAEAAPVVPAEQPAPVVVASDAAAAPAAQANPVPAPSASPEEQSASQKYESPVVQSAPAESSDMVQYMGIWYEAERYFAVFEFAGKCVSANYTNEGNGIYRVVNTQTSS